MLAGLFFLRSVRQSEKGSYTLTFYVAGAIALLAGTLAGFAGFGFNIVAVPLLSLVMSAKQAVVTAVCAGLIVQTVLTVSVWRAVTRRIVLFVGAGSLFGMGIGVQVFDRIPETAVAIAVSFIAIVFGIHGLLGKTRSDDMPKGSVWAGWSLGLIAGFVTAITGMGGPPVVAYLMNRGLTPKRLRATLAACSVAVSALVLAGIIAVGAASWNDVRLAAAIAPAAIAGLVLGASFFRVRTSSHRKASAGILLAIGLIAVLRTL